ncbi:50S ribosomal protein L29 [Mesoplasma florum L1]|uniref:Large ribosomal subunit protein uL29 n=4 Tax=Mesoplasma TaxID=46239 RepID=Q6F1Y6_MESFL|nr:50S ribosomal protein L29 [Mesoplasma florum L1]AGY41203.1 LSU ribosomal protein L29p (L35e) [Mesoplasma florum W37]ATI73086.1 50S ribosomal protein L29 [Mesoplasma florum]ATQ35291.1 50S ribosomal protein L29 [Mesoplasma entomophilum]ATZ20659.1 50S ribosomal protein L29 [Mesoplasma coleopterae]
MANKLMDEIRALSVEQLLERNEAKKAELFALKFQAAVGSLEQTHRIKEIKKEIARIQLVIAEKAKAGEEVNKTVKTNYNQAVTEAEKAGKEVRAKQRKMIEELQAQYENNGASNDDAIAEAMANAVVEEQNDVNEGETK